MRAQWGGGVRWSDGALPGDALCYAYMIHLRLYSAMNVCADLRVVSAVRATSRGALGPRGPHRLPVFLRLCWCVCHSSAQINHKQHCCSLHLRMLHTYILTRVLFIHYPKICYLIASDLAIQPVQP